MDTEVIMRPLSPSCLAWFRTWAILLLVAWTGGAAAQDKPSAPEVDDPAQREYLAGNGLLQRGLYELAAAEYRAFLSHHPEHAKSSLARYGLGVCLFRLGKFDDALSEITPLLPDHRFEFAAEVATMCGQCHLAAGHYAEAADAFSRVVKNYASHDLADDAAAGCVEALYRAKRYKEAVKQADELAARWPGSPLLERSGYFCAASLIASGDDAAAAGRLQRVLEQFPRGTWSDQATLMLAQCLQRGRDPMAAAPHYRKLVAAKDGKLRPQALLGLAMVLAAANQAPDAAKLLDELLKQYPRDAAAGPARLERARLWLDAGTPDKAAALLRQIPADDPELGDDRAYWLAKCALRAGRPAEAAEQLRDAMEKHPGSHLRAEMSYDRAVALMQHGDDEAASEELRSFRKAFADHALSPDVLQLLATAAHRRKQYDQSAALCAEFAKRFASHPLAAGVAFLAAENEFLAGRFDSAAAAFRRFVSTYPNDKQAPAARMRLGLALQRIGKLDEAAAALSDAAAAAGQDQTLRSSRRSLGEIAFEQGRWKDAAQQLSRYLAETPDAPAADDAWLRLALAQERDGRPEDALKSFAKLIDGFPDSAHRVQALFERGQCLMALHRFDEAEAPLREVIRAPGNERFAPHAVAHLAAIAMRRGDFAAAARQFGDVAGQTTDPSLLPTILLEQGKALLADHHEAEAASIFRRITKEFAGAGCAAAARAQLAIALARQDRPAEALAEMQRIKPADAAGLDAPLRSTLAYEKGCCLRRTGKSDDAARELASLAADAAAGALRWHAVCELSAIHFEAKKYDEAAKLLEGLHAQCKSDPAGVPSDLKEAGLYRLAICEFEAGRNDRAAERLGEFCEQFDKSTLRPSAAYFLGEALVRAGKHHQAIKPLLEATRSPPGDDVLAAALLRLGECYAALQRWEKSERSYSEYLDRFAERENWFQAQFGVGLARENLGRVDEAISAYRKVIERHKGPTAARAQFQIGECLFAQGKLEDASRELLKVDILYACPEWSAAALFEAGRCFEKLNKLAEARAQFTQVGEKFKQTRWAELSRQRLSELSSSAGLPGH